MSPLVRSKSTSGWKTELGELKSPRAQLAYTSRSISRSDSSTVAAHPIGAALGPIGGQAARARSTIASESTPLGRVPKARPPSSSRVQKAWATAGGAWRTSRLA
jgi:hypothetical protein